MFELNFKINTVSELRKIKVIITKFSYDLPFSVRIILISLFVIIMILMMMITIKTKNTYNTNIHKN